MQRFHALECLGRNAIADARGDASHMARQKSREPGHGAGDDFKVAPCNAFEHAVAGGLHSHGAGKVFQGGGYGVQGFALFHHQGRVNFGRAAHANVDAFERVLAQFDAQANMVAVAPKASVTCKDKAVVCMGKRLLALGTTAQAAIKVIA